MKGKLLLKTVNKALQEAGARETLVKGDGNFYFYGGSAHMWSESGVMVSRLNDLTVEQWVEEWKQKKAEHDREH